MQNNYLFAMQFREGFAFGRVVKRRICQWKPWELIDANGVDIDIAPASAQGELRFRDPRNTQNDILYLESPVNSGFPWFFHGAFGIAPAQVQMYLRYPEGDIIPGKFPAVDPVRPAAGDRITNLNGVTSPYEMPTDYQETIIVPGVHLGCEYYNLDAIRAHQPVINILFSLYWCEIFNPAEHSDLINAIASRRAPATYLSVGFGDLCHDMGSLGSLDEWRGEGAGSWEFKPLTLDEARNITPGGAVAPGFRRRNP